MAPFSAASTNQFLLETKAQTLSLIEICLDKKEVKQIHAHMYKTGLILDTIPASKLLTFCSTPGSGDLAYARLVFSGIRQPNTFMWNTMIRGYSKSKNPEEALLLYHEMLHDSIPHNYHTFPFLLKACANLSALEETQQIHTHIVKTGFISDIYTSNSLLHVYTKYGYLDSAFRIFKKLSKPDIVSWNSMIDGYSKNGEASMAIELFNRMPLKNLISWTSMINGYLVAGKFNEALRLFHEMQISGVKPDIVALASALTACSHLGALEQGKWIHAYIDKNKIEIDSILGCILVDMYAKCGDVDEGFRIFRNMKKRDTHIWSAMISGFAAHGRGKEALNLFMDMQKEAIKPNSLTFTGVLNACSHAGLVEEGKFIFKTMEKSYQVTPSIEHYGCMVDLLGRAGLLKEAKYLIETMEMTPNEVILGALLNACIIHRNFELGKKVGKLLIELNPNHGGRYIHLASIFSAASQWDRAVEVRKVMEDRGVAKLPGCSAISLNGVVHEFFAGDQTHPEISEIYLMWEQIAEGLAQEGYVPMTKNFLLDLDSGGK